MRRGWVLLMVGVLACAAEDDGEEEPELIDCEQYLTEAECTAAEPKGFQWCAWSTWVPTTVAEDGTCEFGPVQGSCVREITGTIGCEGQYGCDDANGGSGGQPSGHSYREGDNGSLLIGTGNGWCFTKQSACTPDGPAECGCVCDPAWPGAPLGPT